MTKTLEQIQKDKKLTEEAINAILNAFMKENPDLNFEAAIVITTEKCDNGKVKVVGGYSHINVLI